MSEFVDGTDMIGQLVDAIDQAEAEALRQHQAGTCHLSEWSCSWCAEAS